MAPHRLWSQMLQGDLVARGSSMSRAEARLYETTVLFLAPAESIFLSEDSSQHPQILPLPTSLRAGECSGMAEDRTEPGAHPHCTREFLRGWLAVRAEHFFREEAPDSQALISLFHHVLKKVDTRPTSPVTRSMALPNLWL